MAEGAKVHSIEAIKAFRTALWKFAEIANVALGDAESETNRVQIWLETEQPTYWQGQARKRHEAVEKAKEALRMKKLFKDPTGARQSYVDEEKALAAAMRRLEEANEKLAAIRKYIPRLQRETHLYKGAVQRFATIVQSDLPVAAVDLSRMLGQLEAYVSLGAPQEAVSEVSTAESGPSMSRGDAEMQPPPATEESDKNTAPKDPQQQ